MERPNKLAATRPPGLSRTLSSMAGDVLCERLNRAVGKGCLCIVSDGRGGSLYVPGSPRCRGKWPTIMGSESCRLFSLRALMSELPVPRGLALLEAICDPCPLKSLERAGVLNWNGECSKFVALRTQSDGNCLAHAASLAVWGVHDRSLLLRQAMRSFFVSDEEGGSLIDMGGSGDKPLLRQCWEAELTKDVPLEQATLDLEWAELQRAASLDSVYSETLGRRAYHYLEQAHVLALAHVLRRPIVVLATDWTDSMGRKLAGRDEISGIYLPLQLPRSLCWSAPLVLAFDSFHFSPLLPLGSPQEPILLPLTDRDGKLLPVPFFRPGGATSGEGEELRRAVVRHWLDCTATLVARYNEDDGDGAAVEGGSSSSRVRQLMEQFEASVLETEAVQAVYGGGGGGGGGGTSTSSSAAKAVAPLPSPPSSSSRGGRQSRVMMQEDADLALALSLAEQEQQQQDASAAVYRNTVPESWWTRQRQQASGGARRRGHWWTAF